MVEYLDVAPFREQALRILAAAEERGLILRLVGALAFHLHCPRFNYIHRQAERAFTDIDFAAHVEQKKQIERLFRSLGYEDDSMVKTIPGLKRSIFHSRTEPWHSDVFYDELDFSHVVDLRGRLEIDYPTISLADLLLEKMQIAQINEKDVIDTFMLLLEHDVGPSDQETINTDHLAKVLRREWGFWKTFMINMDKVDQLLGSYPVLSVEDRDNVREKIQRIKARVEKEPATTRWRLRSLIGERMKWYRDVDEVLGG